MTNQGIRQPTVVVTPGSRPPIGRRRPAALRTYDGSRRSSSRSGVTPVHPGSYPRQSLTQRDHYGLGQRLPGPCGEFPSEPISLGILDTESHV